jgi:hypothetical protein
MVSSDPPALSDLLRGSVTGTRFGEVPSANARRIEIIESARQVESKAELWHFLAHPVPRYRWPTGQVKLALYYHIDRSREEGSKSGTFGSLIATVLALAIVPVLCVLVEERRT